MNKKRTYTYGLGARIAGYIMAVIWGTIGILSIIYATTPLMLVLGIVNTIIGVGNLVIAIKFAISVRQKY